MPREILEEIEDKEDLLSILNKNPGLVVIKFGAEWCGPCKFINSEVHDWFEKMSDNVICYDLDVDKNFEIYAYLKTKKQVSSIPAILAWKKGNTMIGPDYSVVGANKEAIQRFFGQFTSK
jgi:thioredoxin 1